jgi:pyruvate dehydrogenase E1 component alpha subunit
MSDPQKYRTKEEVTRYEEHDPIGRLEKVLREKGALDDAKVTAMNQEIHDIVERAHAEADAAPFPPSEDIWKDVYAQPFGPYLAR